MCDWGSTFNSSNKLNAFFFTSLDGWEETGLIGLEVCGCSKPVFRNWLFPTQGGQPPENSWKMRNHFPSPGNF